VERTRYEVPEWGVGELWSADGVVLAHEFDFGTREWEQGRAVAIGTEATFLEAGPDPAARAGIAKEHAADVISRVCAFLRGEDVALGDIPIDLDWCTDFQCEVISALRGIPRGDVVSYGELAALAGHPGAQRAVGSICAGNRFAFLVPCHRVVASDGIGRYGSAGVEVKRRLLALEGVVL